MSSASMMVTHPHNMLLLHCIHQERANNTIYFPRLCIWKHSVKTLMAALVFFTGITSDIRKLLFTIEFNQQCFLGIAPLDMVDCTSFALHDCIADQISLSEEVMVIHFLFITLATLPYLAKCIHTLHAICGYCRLQCHQCHEGDEVFKLFALPQSVPFRITLSSVREPVMVLRNSACRSIKLFGRISLSFTLCFNCPQVGLAVAAI